MLSKKIKATIIFLIVAITAVGSAAYFYYFQGVEESSKIELQDADFVNVSTGERIYVRKVGHGPNPVVLLPGNNTSGGIFEPILSVVRAVDEYNDNYTFYAFDYRGSGKSSYNSKITSLRDFARDFNDIVQRSERLSEGGITLVGYSMGFGVAQEMVIMDPSKYSDVISFSGIGSRGIRTTFNQSTAGTNPATGETYKPGDWSDSLSATRFQQRTWQGKNRTYSNVKFVWNMMVFNDILKFNPATYTIDDDTFTSNPFYESSLRDVLSVEYMPESLHYCHLFNNSGVTLTHTNHDNTVVEIPGENELGAFEGKRVLLVKAKTDYVNWRGDLVIADHIFRTTKYDLTRAGATVSAVLFDPNEGFDHGWPITHPLTAVRLIDEFASSQREPTTSDLDPIIGSDRYTIYHSSEENWEMRRFW